MSDSKFDAYEYVGVIVPGTVLVLGGLLLFPNLNPVPSLQSFAVGDLGIFLLVAFVAGHLVQGVGNLVEKGWWFIFGGMPTDWMVDKPEKLLAPKQAEKLNRKVGNDFNLGGSLPTITKRAWFPITREIYAQVNAAGRSDRADAFNRTYGLMWGLTAAFFTLAALVMGANFQDWRAALICAILGIVALARMHLFGKHYAREVFVQYLDL